MNIGELEILRKKEQQKKIKNIIIFTIIFLLLFLVTRHLVFSLFFGYIIYVIIVLIISKINPIQSTDSYDLAYKYTFVLNSLKTTFTNLVYEPKKGLDKEIIRSTKMMDMGDSYSSNDFISGKYKNINFIRADVHIEEEKQDDDGAHTETIFRGSWMVFDFNKPFMANIQVCQKGFENAEINNWGDKLKFKKVLMEDQSFNDNFKIYAQNEHDAFYILTPSFMEKIKKLNDEVNGPMLLCFLDNKLHVGIQNGKDFFEVPGIFKKLNEKEIINNITQEIKLITCFVDELDLNNKLFGN